MILAARALLKVTFFLGTWGVVKVNDNILFVCLFVRLLVCFPELNLKFWMLLIVVFLPF